MSRVLVVTGSYPPDICGCGDYVARLSDELHLLDLDLDVFLRRDWKIGHLFGYARAIRQSGAALINLQYPTESYGYSITPMLLCMLLGRRRTVVTLHEFTSKSLHGKLAIYLFFLFSRWVIFTTEFEKDAACRVAPWLKNRSSVIPIGSNIPMQAPQAPNADIVYFGLIRPMKGIEQFISTVTKLKAQREIRVRAVGQIVPKYAEYAADILKQLHSIGVEVIVDAGPTEVSEILSRSRVAFLPFPDGMSQRRGSALAAMGNGALVVTTPSANEPARYRDICVTPTATLSLEQALGHVLDNVDGYQAIREAGQQYARSIVWRGVASAYLDLFEHLRARRASTPLWLRRFPNSPRDLSPEKESKA